LVNITGSATALKTKNQLLTGETGPQSDVKTDNMQAVWADYDCTGGL
jgi:hypothetical protein